ncbi:MAG TPA: hypothetical protein VNE61_08750 [Ktedonobacteraceae bacterium]|nr:hypothetical protein [Ktedonobacteraceae bacterium]
MKKPRLLRRSLLVLMGLCLLLSFGVLTAPRATRAAPAVSRSTLSLPAKDRMPILPRALAGSNQLSVPNNTDSLYESTTDAATLYNQGCTAATGPAGLIILDWGQPVYLGNGVYGTYDFGGHDDSVASITKAIDSFAQGVWGCHNGSTNLAVAAGESNYYSGKAIPRTVSAWTADGHHWGQMVNNIQSYIATNHYNSVVGAYGAGDLEVEWEGFKLTKALVDGYNHATTRVFFDFGDDSPGYWTNYQVWYVAYGAKDNLPLPEIYFNADATYDWEPLSIWACSSEGAPIYFRGTMAENVQGENTPAQAFTAMYNAEQSNSCTAAVSSGLIFSTEIFYA